MLQFSRLVFGICLIALMALLNSCNNCGTCLNGGECNNGVCDCPEGYSGDHCEIVDCTDVVCITGSLTLIDGECGCSDGSEPYDPNQPNNTALYLGTYSVSETCDSWTYDYNMDVVQGTGSNAIVLENFGDFGINVNAMVSGLNLTIPSQTRSVGSTPITISGYGELTPAGNELTIYYDYSTSSFSSESCTLNCTK